MAKGFWKRKKFSLIIFLLIISLGFFLRTRGIESYPVELHSQEALLGWRAKSLLLTFGDETGRKLPLVFSSLEGYQLPLASYLIIPFIKVLGLTVLAVRLPFALVSTLAIPALFGVVYFLFPKNRKMASWSAFFLAINPWTVYLSRNCSVENLSFSLFLMGLCFWFLSDLKKNYFRWSAILFLILSLFTAKIAWFFVPPFLVFAWLFLFKRQRRVLVDILIVFLFFLPLLLSYLQAPQVQTDLLNHDLTLFGNLSISRGIDLMRGENLQFGSAFLGRIFYNKLFYLQNLIANFLKHFNPRFYFISGDGQPLHGLTNFGPVLFLFLPITLFGIWKMWKEKRNFLILLALWFCLATLPSSLVFSSPDTTRVIFVLPVLALITAYGLSRLKKSYLVLFLILLSFNFAFVSYDALVKEPLRFQEEKQIGYQELADYLKENFDHYQLIYLSDGYGADPGPALLFYFDYPVEEFQKTQGQELVYRKWIERLDKILINQRQLWEPGEENLYLITPDEEKLYEIKGEFNQIATIENLSGEPIFLVFEYEEKI